MHIKTSMYIRFRSDDTKSRWWWCTKLSLLQSSSIKLLKASDTFDRWVYIPIEYIKGRVVIDTVVASLSVLC